MTTTAQDDVTLTAKENSHDLSRRVQVTNKMCAAGISAWEHTLGTPYTRYEAIFIAMLAAAPAEQGAEPAVTQDLKLYVDCCCARHHPNHGRCLQCPIHGCYAPKPAPAAATDNLIEEIKRNGLREDFSIADTERIIAALQAEQSSYEVLEAAANECAKLYACPAKGFEQFDLLQGWQAALDLAEQRILALKATPAPTLPQGQKEE